MGMQLSGSLELTGSFTTSGAIVAQTLVVQTITSSITQMTGSNIFGSSLSNIQQMTGSLKVTGSTATFAGNVGIGTASPSEKLEVNGNIKLNNGSVDGGQLVLSSLGYSDWNIDSYSGSLRSYYGASVATTITAAGNVGIGTSSPDTLLTINSASGTKSFALVNSGGSTRADFTITENDGLYINSNEGATSRNIILQTGGTERMRVLSTGNIAIGANGASNIGGFGSTVVTIQSPNSTYATLELGKATASTNANLGVLSFFNGANADICNIIGVSTDANNSGALRFNTVSAGSFGERMRVTSETGTANVCIGTTSSPQANAGRGALTVNGTSTSIVTMAVGGAEKGYVYHNGTDINFVNSTAGGRLYAINVSAGVYLTQGATSWTSNSDERLKNINSNIENALEKLSTLRTVSFSWKSDETNKENLGLIAQDVEAVFPQVIDRGKLPSTANEKQTDETEYLGVRYQELVPVLVKAIQELEARVKELENK